MSTQVVAAFFVLFIIGGGAIVIAALWSNPSEQPIADQDPPSEPKLPARYIGPPPEPPPPKSKRLTAKDRQKREWERRWGIPTASLFAWLILPGMLGAIPVMGGYWLLGIIVVPVAAAWLTGKYNQQDWVQRGWREEEEEEREKWRQEDAAEEQYKKDYQAWLDKLDPPPTEEELREFELDKRDRTLSDRIDDQLARVFKRK